MKNLLVGMTLISTAAMAEGTNLYLRTGADLWQRFDVVKVEDAKLNKKDADDFGYEIAAELTREFYPNLELGIGLAYQEHGNPEKYIESHGEYVEFPDISSIPVYFTAKYNFPTENMLKPYLKADLGYSFNRFDEKKLKFGDVFYPQLSDEIDADIKDGVYFGLGAGFEYNNFTADLMYKINKAEMKAGTYDYKVKKDLDYSRVTLSVGYKFNL